MNKAKIYTNSKDEGYTPKYIVDMFGKFNTDPATTYENAVRLKIPNYYTKETDGLKQEGYGRVGLNPPFSNKNEGIKKAREYVNRTNNDVVILLPLAPETEVGQKYILGYAEIFIPNKRINFMNEKFQYQKGTAFTSVIVKLTKEKCNTYKVIDIKGNQND